jgi:hypothetical protein
MPEDRSENQPKLLETDHLTKGLLGFPTNGEFTPEDDATINRQFFHPFPPPDLSGIVKRSDLFSARRQNIPIPFELPLNWPPIGWESDDCPLDDSLDRLRQWFTFLVGSQGVLRINERFAIGESGWQAISGSVYVRDTWRLIEHLKAKGSMSVPYQEESREYTAHEALVAIALLKEQVFSESPKTSINDIKADEGEDQRLEKLVPADHSKAESEKTTGSACGDRWVFAPDGDGFSISAFGASGHFESLKGFEYIAKLIASPGRKLAMVDLLGGKYNAQQIDRQFSKQPVLDEAYKVEIREKLRELDADLIRAKEANHIGEIERLTKEKETYHTALSAALGLCGRDRELNYPVDKMRSTIHSALAGAYEKLRNSKPPMDQLAKHLKASISANGPTFIYDSSPLLPWSFEKLD